MVIDLQVTPPKPMANSRKIYPDYNDNPASYYHEQLSIMKTNLLNPAEVKFANDSEHGNKKRLRTISSVSSSGSVPSLTTAKKKIPDGGYGWVSVEFQCQTFLRNSWKFLFRRRSLFSQGNPSINYAELFNYTNSAVYVFLLCSLMVSLIADGVSFSFGLIYTELLDYFGEGTTKTAWVGGRLVLLLHSTPLTPLHSRSDHCSCRCRCLLDQLCRT